MTGSWATRRRGNWLRLAGAAWMALLSIAIHGTHTCGLSGIGGDAACDHSEATCGNLGGHASSSIEPDGRCDPSRKDEACLACHFLTACKALSLAPAALAFAETPAARLSATGHDLACPISRRSPSAPRAPPSA